MSQYDHEALKGAAAFFENAATGSDPAPLAFAQAIHRTAYRQARLIDLVECLIDNDPNDTIADNGATVFDLWRHEACELLKRDPTQAGSE